MQDSKLRKAQDRSFLSPLFVDTEFVPNKMRYFTLFNRQVTNVPTVLPYENDSISLKDLEEQVSSICSPRDNNTSISLSSSLNLTKHDSVKGLKYRSCKKKLDGEEIEANEDGSVDFDRITSRSSESESCERFDLCLIMMNKVDEVIHLSFRWKSEEQARQEILNEVNRSYSADLKLSDLFFNSLIFECRKGQSGETALKFNPKPIKAIILDTGKAICLFKINSTVYCSDANSTAYQYPLADASIIQLKNGQPAVEVKLDGTVYELKTGKVVSWCPKNSLVRNVLGSLKDKEEPVDLPVYAVDVRGDDIFVNLSRPL